MIIFSRFIGFIPIDAVLVETIDSSLTITKNPIESGADVTDHAYLEPKTITLDCVIGGSLSRPSFGGRLEAVAGYQALKALQASKQPFTFISGLDIHRNVLIEQLLPSRDKDTSWILKFTLILREIIIVSSAYTSGEAAGPAGGQARNLSKNTLAGDTKTQGSPVVQRGDVTQTPVTTKTQLPSSQYNGSVLYNAFGGG